MNVQKNLTNCRTRKKLNPFTALRYSRNENVYNKKELSAVSVFIGSHLGLQSVASLRNAQLGAIFYHAISGWIHARW